MNGVSGRNKITEIGGQSVTPVGPAFRGTSREALSVLLGQKWLASSKSSLMITSERWHP